MWKLYDILIDQIPEGITVAETIMGDHWIGVHSTEDGLGLAMRINATTIQPTLKGERRGMPLKELAQAAKSWNLVEAGYGVAAINAYHNHRDRVKAPRAGPLRFRREKSFRFRGSQSGKLYRRHTRRKEGRAL